MARIVGMVVMIRRDVMVGMIGVIRIVGIVYKL